MEKKTSFCEPVNMPLPEPPSCLTSHELMSSTNNVESRRDHFLPPSEIAPARYDTDPNREGANLLKLQSCQSLVMTPLNRHSQKVQILLGSF
jgi:hypothetical protein